MLKSLIEVMKQLLGLAKDTQENRDDIRALQTRLEMVTETLHQVVFELQRVRENEAHEREKMGLRLENVLLRSERSLPPGSTSVQTRLSRVEEQVADLQKDVENLRKRRGSPDR